MSNNQLPPFFYELFDASLPRLGPGYAGATQRAIQRALENLGPDGTPSDGKIRMLDIGCGNGPQTIELAKHVDGLILAVDNHQPYLDELQRRAEAAGVSEKIEPQLGDMHDLGLEEEGSFDLIWSEGAFFVMGISEALKMCYRLLRPQGVLGMSDLVWFTPDPPQRCKEYLDARCPIPIRSVDARLAEMKEFGYEVLEHFSLPESVWLDFYDPLEKRLKPLSEKWAGDADKMALLRTIEEEIENYRSYSAYFGYEFFVLKRP